VQELQPSGKLIFTIKTYLPDGFKREWMETDGKTLESLVSEILVTFIAAGPLLVEQRRQREEAERQRQAAEYLRYQRQQQRKRDDNRWRCFVGQARSWREAEIARNFLAALKRDDIDLDQEIEGRSLRDWLSWAEDRLNTADAINGGATKIFEAVASITEWTSRD
jgi:hypothetical protein